MTSMGSVLYYITTSESAPQFGKSLATNRTRDGVQPNIAHKRRLQQHSTSTRNVSFGTVKVSQLAPEDLA